MQSWSYAMSHAPSIIAREKLQAIQAISFEQHMVTLFTYVYIRSFLSKKYKVMLSLPWKFTETNAETVAWYSTQQPVKLLVRCYLKN